MGQQDNQEFQKQQVKQQPQVKDNLKQNAGAKDQIEKDAASCGTGNCGTNKKPQ